MNLRNLALSLLACVLAASACGGDENDPGLPPATGPVESVEVTPATAKVAEAKTLQLRAIARNAEGRELSGVAISWRSLDEEVATVDATGLVKGVLPGSAQIVAEAEGKAGTSQVEVETGKVASVSIEPARSTLALGQELVFTAVAKNDEGGVLLDRRATWTSSDDSIVSIGPDGKAWAKAKGEVTIGAEVDGVPGSLALSVVDAVASRVSIEPGSFTIAEAQTQILVATVFDDGDAEIDWDVEWSSDDESVATVIAGQVRGVRPGMTRIVAVAGEVSAFVTATVIEAEVVSVEITTRDPQVAIGESARIIASARSANGAVERPLDWTSSNPEVATVDSFGRIAGKSYGTTTITATYQEFSATVELETIVALSRLKAGGDHACGLTPNTGRPICFGANGKHQLGTDTTETAGTPPEPISMMPVAVNAPADLRFSDIFVGGRHTCALANDGAAWCWGDNAFGQLGNGETGGDVREPVKVQMPAGTKFTTLALGDDFTCAIAQMSNEVWCWGNEAEGRIGRNPAFSGPANVPGKTIADRVSEISAGQAHACAVNEAGEGLCWGRNDRKQVGASTDSVASPYSVALGSGQSFKSISAGGNHSCGLLQGGETYCWGANEKGQLGVPGSGDFSVPQRNGTNVRFDSIITGADFTCALARQGNGAVQGDAYCWGGNGWGQLGKNRIDGYQTEGVHSTVGFKSLSAGRFHVCGMSLTPEKGYCWGVANKGQLGRRVVVDSRPGRVDGQL